MKIKERLKKIIAGFMTAQMILSFMALPQPVKAAVSQSVNSFTLMNATTDIDIMTLTNGTVVNLASYPNINVRANTDPLTVGSVKFDSNCIIDGDYTRIENIAPYAASGDTGGNYWIWSQASNYIGSTCTITATPYELSGAGGTVGTPLAVSFLLVNDALPPQVSGVANGGKYKNPVTITISDESAYSATLNGAPFVNGSTVSVEGVYELVATDITGKTAIVNFILDMTAPFPPDNLFPANGSFIKPSNLTKVDWGDVADGTTPVTYKYEVSNTPGQNLDNSFTAPLYTSGWSTDSEIPTPGTPEGIYYWHAKAKDGAGNESFWGDVWMFTVDGTNPSVDPISDVGPMNIPTLVTSTASDSNGITNYLWEMVSGPTGGSLVFSNPIEHETKISAVGDGGYIVRVTASDAAGNSTPREFKFTWDGTVNPVTDFYLVTGDGFVDLHWANPSLLTDPDFSGVKIYRSTVEGQLGTELATVAKTGNSYEDIMVLNGTTYYYTVQARDDIGNTKNSVQISATPTAPRYVLATSFGSQSDASFGEADQVTQNPAEGEVKSGTSDQKEDENKTEENKDTKSLPYFGIALLVILALVGVYLLYLQNPEWFGALMFWKKK